MKTLFLTILFFSFSVLSSEDAKKNEEILWDKQEEYLKNLEYLNNELINLNTRLDKCRDKYFISANEKEKSIFLKTTEKHSIELLTMNAMVSQSIENIKMKMKNNKEAVLGNLKKFENKIENHLKQNRERTNRIINNMKDGMEEISEYYCR